MCLQVGADFAPLARNCRLKSMHDFSYEPDALVAAALDMFLKTEWNGFQKRKDLYCSPYTMTKDGMFILDELPGHPQICLFTGGNGRAFKFSILLGRYCTSSSQYLYSGCLDYHIVVLVSSCPYSVVRLRSGCSVALSLH